MLKLKRGGKRELIYIIITRCWFCADGGACGEGEGLPEIGDASEEGSSGCADTYIIPRLVIGMHIYGMQHRLCTFKRLTYERSLICKEVFYFG